MMERSALITLLKSANPFKYLDDNEIIFLINCGHILKFLDKDQVLTQGAKGNGLYIVLEGHLKVSMKLLGKGTIALANLSPGSFFGEISLLHDPRCIASICSEGESLCFLFKTETFHCLPYTFPEMRNRILQALIEEIILRQCHMIHAMKKYTRQFLQAKTLLHLYKNQIDTLTVLDPSFHDLAIFFNKFSTIELPKVLPNPYIRNKLECPNNHVLIHQKQRDQSCFYIVKGAVQVGIITASGFSKFAVIGPETLICPTSMLNNKPELFIYLTIGTTTVLEIPQEAFDRMKQNHLSVWYCFYDLLIIHVIALQKKLNAQILLMESSQQDETHV